MHLLFANDRIYVYMGSYCYLFYNIVADCWNGSWTQSGEEKNKDLLESMELIYRQSYASPSREPNLSKIHIEICTKTQLIHPQSNRWWKDSNETMSRKLIVWIDIKIHKIGNKSINKRRRSRKAWRVERSREGQNKEEKEKMMFLFALLPISTPILKYEVYE